MLIERKKQPNRQRPFAYSFRVSAAEKTLLDRKVTASGMNRTDYLIRTLSDKPVVSIDNGHEILYELKRHGNNLNQAVKSGYYGYDTEQEILSAVPSVRKRIENCQKPSEVRNATTQRKVKQKHAERGNAIRYQSRKGGVCFRSESL